MKIQSFFVLLLLLVLGSCSNNRKNPVKPVAPAKEKAQTDSMRDTALEKAVSKSLLSGNPGNY